MKYRVIIPDRTNTPCIYHLDEEYLAMALYRAAILHEKTANIQKIEKGRWVNL